MSHRPLTAGEIALAKTVFGDSVDYTAVRLHNKRIMPRGLQGSAQPVAVGNNISFPRTAYSEDFSREPVATKQADFIHELTHVWQHQNKVLSTPREAIKETLRHRFNYQAAYPYKLEDGKDLTEYGFEQQAAMVEDYFLLTRHDTTASYKNRRITQGDAETLRKKHEAVLKNFLENPAYARGLMNRKNKKSGPKKKRWFF
ncbi:MAG: hypothetical protein GC185_09845 [Alphaproteobacteria bacterium]|nr:hypothetical protein [Alphaproteobacteria bacterium]